MPTASAYVPEAGDLETLRAASASCKGCPLYQGATQAVFGEGSPEAAVVLVGEQPGDHEDRVGRPFVGPAGRLLRESMAEAGLTADEVYLTNAVKHFKFAQRGKVRLHKKPALAEVRACAPWLRAELQVLCPRVVVALGATAGQSLLGPDLKVTRDRGTPKSGPDGLTVFPTIHPSAILRAPDGAERAAARDQFVADLHAAAVLAQRPSAGER